MHFISIENRTQWILCDIYSTVKEIRDTKAITFCKTPLIAIACLLVFVSTRKLYANFWYMGTYIDTQEIELYLKNTYEKKSQRHM